MTVYVQALPEVPVEHTEQDFEVVQGREVIITVNGAPVPELVDFRIIPGKRTLVLFIHDQGVHCTRRINLSTPGAGLLALNPLWGNVMITRGQKGATAPAFGQRCRNLVGVYACDRRIAESLAALLWGEQTTYPDWQEPNREGVPAAQHLPQAAD